MIYVEAGNGGKAAAEDIYLLLYLHHLTIPHLRPFNLEADKRALFMPALTTGSTGIHVEAAETVVVHYLKNVRMSADEELGIAFGQLLSGQGTVSAGITADVYHQHIDLLYPEAQNLRKDVADFGIVYVAPDASQGPECPEPLHQLHTSKIACMPDLVAIAEMMKNLVIKPAMSI